MKWELLGSGGAASSPNIQPRALAPEPHGFSSIQLDQQFAGLALDLASDDLDVFIVERKEIAIELGEHRINASGESVVIAANP